MMREGAVATRSVVVNTFKFAWQEEKLLGTWQLADAAQLDKHNGKGGTKAIPLINMLDPLGKLFSQKCMQLLLMTNTISRTASMRAGDGSKLFLFIML